MDRTSCAETAMVESSENTNRVRFFKWKYLREKIVGLNCVFPSVEKTW